MLLTVVLLYTSLRFESAFVVGLIEDFATVVLFVVDALFFGIPLTGCSVVGCALVAFVVVSIGFQKKT